MTGFALGSTDAGSLAAASRDYGNLVHRRPVAVVRPESVDQVVEAVRLARRCGLRVAARGQGHSTDGQAQVEGGVVVDMSALHRVERIGDGSAVVQCGLRWRELIAESIPRGWAPPVLTGYTGLSVGGTLSMGGIGGASFRHGAQVDQVLALDVVTGTGDVVTCSADVNADLFDAVRGGVGQYGILVRATLRMAPAPPRARHLALSYAPESARRFFADLEALASGERGVDGVYGQIVPSAGGGAGWAYVIHVARFVAADADGAAESSRALEALAGLGFDGLRVASMDRFAFDTLVDAGNDERARRGLGDVPRVWHDAFLPAAAAEAFVAETLRATPPSELGPAGFVLLFPVRNHGRDYALRLPPSARVYLFDVLTSGAPDDAGYASAQRAAARRMFERARRAGGTLYPIGSTRMTPDDWAQQFGALHARFAEAKRRFDPAAMLAPGAGVFAAAPDAARSDTEVEDRCEG